MRPQTVYKILHKKINPDKNNKKKLGDLGVVPLDAGRKMTKIGGSGASVAPTATPFSPRDIFPTFGLSSTTPAHKIKPLGTLRRIPWIRRIPRIPRIPRKWWQLLVLRPPSTRRGPG